MKMKFTPNENALRVALIVFSILFGILSVSLIALGTVYIDELWWPKRYVGLDFLELPTLLIVLGSVSLLMSLVGCFCAKSYNRRFLLAFGCVLFIILCLELTIAVIAFINFDEHEGNHTKTHKIMYEQLQNQDPVEQLAFHDIEDHYECCGITGFEETCVSAEPVEEYLVTVVTGCAEAVDDHIQTIAMETGYYAVVLLLLQVVEMAYVYLILGSLQKYV